MNEDNRNKIVRLMGEAAELEGHRLSRRAVWLAFLAGFVASMAMAGLLAYIYITSHVQETEARAETSEARNAELGAEKAKLASEVKRQRELIYYSELLPVKDLRVRRHDGRLFFTGQVKNLSRRAVGDIKLTAFFTDPDGSITSMAGYAARPSDGRPLYKGQRRHFRFDLDAPEASDVHVVITGIEFK